MEEENMEGGNMEEGNIEGNMTGSGAAWGQFRAVIEQVVYFRS
jgi:hypothetical protein